MRGPVDPVFDEPVKYTDRHWQYEASEIIRLIAKGECGIRSSKVSWLCVKDSEYLEYCRDDCDFHGSTHQPKHGVWVSFAVPI